MSKIIDKLKHEPVAVWGVVIAAVLTVLASVGVSSTIVDGVTGALSLAGIPVVRGRVTPVQAIEAVVKDTADTASVA